MAFLKKLSIVIAAFTALETVGTAQAALVVNSESAVVNPNTQQVLFTLDFNEVPNFFLVDAYNRQADSFQYFIEADGELPVFRGSPYYSQLETIVRAEEIHVAGDIRVRNVFPIGSDEPNSGGWGSLRGSVPYTLNDTVLTFSAPLQLIGDSDGLFSYRLEWYEFGEFRGFKDNKSAITQSVPEHTSIFGILAFGALCTGLLLKRKQTLAKSVASPTFHPQRERGGNKYPVEKA